MNPLRNVNSTPIRLTHRIGNIIYEQRILKQLTLKETSENICTPSYLSRIEKGYVTPSEHIINSLCNRLNISQTKPADKNSKWLDELMDEIYENDHSVLQFRLSHLNTSTEYHQWFQKFLIHTILENMSDSNVYFDLLRTKSGLFSSSEEHTYLFFSGIYFLKKNDINKAFSLFHQSLTYPFPNPIIFPLLYFYCGKLYRIKLQDMLAIEFFKKSLTSFEQQYYLKYLNDCRLELADLYLINHLFQPAKQLLHDTKSNLESSDFYNQTPYFIFIWGNYYYKKRDYAQAELYYKKALLLNETIFDAHIMLARLAIESNNLAKKKNCYSTLEKLNFNRDKRNEIKLKYYLFLLEDKRDEFFRIYLEKEAIPFAKTSGFEVDYILYCVSLATYFEQIRKFKKAYTIYKSIQHFLPQLLQ